MLRTMSARALLGRMPARTLTVMLATFAMAMATSAGAQESYPDKPIKIVVPYAAGGAVDPWARVLADKLSGSLKQAIIVENRAGAGGSIGINYVIRAAHDGYNLLAVPAGVAITPYLYAKTPYDLDRDLTPVGLINRTPMLIVTSPRLGITTLQGLFKLAHDKPGTLNYGISGIGTLDHLVFERLRVQAKLNMARIDYQGVPAQMTAVLAHDIAAIAVAENAALPQIRAGKLVPLAILSERRSPLLPNVPTMKESGVDDFVMYGWSMIFVPTGVPRPIAQTLHDAIAKAVSRPDVQKLIADAGSDSVELSMDQLKAFVRKDAATFSAVINANHIRIE
jgi:tripartite-type tricarboxylate transporter receptor subunit TctC